MSQNQPRIIPIYASNGEADALLIFPYLFNRSGEWIGWVRSNREVYSVIGAYVGSLSDDARIIRKRSDDETRPRVQPPPNPGKMATPPSIPLAPLMSDLPLSLIDVLLDEPERLHTLDSGELREDLD
jgi:hypothetical protein